MIRINRLVEPQILQKKQSEWRDELCADLKNYYQSIQNEKKQPQPSRRKPTAKSSRYAHDQVKQQLAAMFGKKCAFCESVITVVSYRNVEHFRPKNIYPKLAYKWENLLFSCTVCNTGHKKLQFPLLDEGTPTLDVNNPCKLDDSDSNTLIDPTYDEPSEYFTFEEEQIISLNERAEITVEVCGLNRGELLDDRREWLGVIETTAYAIILAQDAGDIDAEEEFRNRLKGYISPPSRYSFMTQVKLQKMGFDISPP